LTLIHKPSAAGQQAFIVDAQNEVCSSADGSTGLWINNTFYESDHQNNGAIFIPFKKDDGSKLTTAIMTHESFSEISSFEWQSENYQLKAFFHLHQESILQGHQVKLFMRPKLLINGHKTTIDIVENATVSLILFDRKLNKRASESFKKVEFKDSQEKTFEFIMPKGVVSVQVELNLRVKKVSTDTY